MIRPLPPSDEDIHAAIFQEAIEVEERRDRIEEFLNAVPSESQARAAEMLRSIFNLSYVHRDSLETMAGKLSAITESDEDGSTDVTHLIKRAIIDNTNFELNDLSDEAGEIANQILTEFPSPELKILVKKAIHAAYWEGQVLNHRTREWRKNKSAPEKVVGTEVSEVREEIRQRVDAAFHRIKVLIGL